MGLRSHWLRFGLALLTCLGVGTLTRAGLQLTAAQTSVVGNWRAGETAIEVSVESWGSDCGPRPASMHSKGGGVVTIEQRDQALLLHGRDQDIRTDACWSRNPAMRRSIASYANGQWLTRCKTADADPRAEQGTYTLRLQDPETLLYRDVSRYDWTLNDSKCIATFTTAQTLTRSLSAAETANAVAAKGGKTSTTTAKNSALAAETAPPAAASGNTGQCVPGPATRLSLRPKRAEIELGQKVCFKARVSDAQDCALSASDVVWMLNLPKGGRGTLVSGCFTAAESPSEAEGEFRITAKRGALQTEVAITVRRADLSSLIAKRMEAASESERLDSDDENEAVSAIEPPKPVAKIATKVEPPAESADAGQRPLILGFGVAALALMGLGLWVRRRQPVIAVAPAKAPLTKTRIDPDSIPPVVSAASPASASSSAAEPAAALSAPAPKSAAVSLRADEPLICPTCHVGYPPNQTTCPNDGATLVPYSEFTERSKRDDREHAKRCPTCGKTYPASASFCGEDGTSLVSAR